VRPVGVSWHDFLVNEVEARRQGDLYRSFRSLDRRDGHILTSDGRELVNFSSNDYLGLASDPEIADAAARAAREFGVGAGSARLVSGTSSAVETLEGRLAHFQGRERAVIFGSGYLANVGVIAALVGRDDAVVADRLVHASIIDGCRLSGAHLYRYRHSDIDSLTEMLQRAADRRARRILVVTESVFSMDGDVARLAEIVEVKERFGAALLVDEAHADGVFGPRGTGLCGELGLADRVELHLGTFSKAFGCYGAYVTGASPWIEYLVNAARTLIYATALPPMVVAAIAAALDRIEVADAARATLASNTARFRSALAATGADTANSSTQIVPALLGGSDRALAVSQALEDAGFLAIAIRPPTVPKGAARLRFSLTALHTPDELDRVVGAFEAILGHDAEHRAHVGS
jgi:8-amino-7-oxononanoate synthase